MSNHAAYRFEPPPEERRRGHRPVEDASERGVAAFAALLLVVLAAIFVGIWLLLGLFERRPTDRVPTPDTVATSNPSRPALQSDPSIELFAVRQREDSLLRATGWVDRERGIARIPIDSAMAVFARRTASASTASDSVDVITESGYSRFAVGVPPPSAPPYRGSSP